VSSSEHATLFKTGLMSSQKYLIFHQLREHLHMLNAWFCS